MIISKEKYDALPTKYKKYFEPFTNNHPTIKPLKLIEYLVKLIKMPKENKILDPFIGAGSTAIICEIMDLEWVGIELEEEYCEIAKARIQAKEEYKKYLESLDRKKRKQTIKNKEGKKKETKNNKEQQKEYRKISLFKK